MKKAGATVAWISIFSNAALFGAKYYVGVQANSIAIIADAWHSLSDTLTSIVVIAGLWLAAKPPDKEHPFGHGRAELIAAVIVGAALAVAGVDFLFESGSRLYSAEKADYTPLALYVVGASVVAKEILARYSFIIAKKIDSAALKADGWHHRTDSVSSAIILIGALFSDYFWQIDAILGMAIAALIIYAAYGILKDSTGALLGERADAETVELIKRLAEKSCDSAGDVHDLKMHCYGAHKEVTFHVRFPAEMSVEKAHDLASKIEKNIFDKMNLQATVHIEPKNDDAYNDT